jgi:uncharacterized protein YcfJ
MMMVVTATTMTIGMMSELELSLFAEPRLDATDGAVTGAVWCGGVVWGNVGPHDGAKWGAMVGQVGGGFVGERVGIAVGYLVTRVRGCVRG